MRKLAWWIGGFAAAALLCAYWIPAGAVLLPGAILAAAGLLFAWMRHPRLLRPAAACLGAGLGLLWCWGYQTFYLRPADILDGTERMVSAEVTQYPQPTPYGGKTEVLLRADGRQYRSILYLEDADAALRPGDVVTAAVKIRRSADSAAGEQNVYDAANGILLRLSLRGAISVDRPAHLPVRWWPAAFSHRLKRAIETMFDGEAAPLLTALLIGDQSGLSYEFQNQMSIAGIRHCVSVSGMNLAILMGVVCLLLGPRRRLCAVVGLPLCWGFTLVAGTVPSIVRSAVMQSFLLLAPLLKRENDLPTSLLTALFLILLPNPRSIANVSLQLSFLSVTGIYLFSGRLNRLFLERGRPVKLLSSHRIIRIVYLTALAEFSASLAVIPLTLPLAAYYFGIISVAAPLAGALLLPAVSVCFAAGLCAVLLFLLFAPAGMVLAWPVGMLARYVFWGSELLSRVPYAALYASGGYMVIFLAYLYAVVLLLTFSRGKRPAVSAACCIPAVLAFCLFLQAREYDGAELTMTALDVGQGQCIYLESGGVSAIYDCGGNSGNAGETAARFLASIGQPGLDILAVSHYDEDHTNGILQLLSRVRVRTVFLPDTKDDAGQRDAIAQAAEACSANVRFVSADCALPFGNGALKLFAPEPGQAGNDACMAARCSAGGFDILMTGDLGAPAEEWLVQTHDLSGTEVLVAGHHGSQSSTSETLLAAADPELVVISVGENSYGHPNAGTMARIRASGATIRRTDQCGNITVRRATNGEKSGH